MEIKNLVLFVFLFFVQTITAQVTVQDSLALIALYDSTGGENWLHKDNWKTLEPVSNWYGVTVRNGRVVKLILKDNNLEGSIPTSIGNLTELEELNFFAEHNIKKLEGTIPASIGNLRKLKKIILNGNNLIGPIPASIGNLTLLEELKISHNPINSSIPLEIGKLKKLRTFSAQKCSLKGTIPDTLCTLPELQTIGFADNSLTGSIPESIGNLENLNALSLNANLLEGKIPSSFFKLKKMSQLNLNGNKLTGKMDSLGNLTNLTQLWLDSNKFTNRTIPAMFKNLTKLNVLSLVKCSLKDSIPSFIGNMDSLHQLLLSDNQFYGKIPENFKQLKGLKHLRIQNNNFNELPDLRELKNLETVFMEENYLTFEDLENNYNIAKDSISYKPQKNIVLITDTTVFEGENFRFKFSIGGSSNKYSWKKLNSSVDILSNSSDLVITSINRTNAGKYFCEITNSIVSDLTLTTTELNIKVFPKFSLDVSDITPESIKINWLFKNNVSADTLLLHITSNNFDTTIIKTNVNKIILQNLTENTKYKIQYAVTKGSLTYSDSIILRTKIKSMATAFPTVNRKISNTSFSLINIPYILDSNLVKNIFNRPEYDYTKLRVYTINDEGNNYKQLKPDWDKCKFEPGVSYLASSKNKIAIKANYGVSVADSSFVTVDIPTDTTNGFRWAMLANPFPDSIHIDSLLGNRNRENKKDNYFYTFNSEISYRSDNSAWNVSTSPKIAPYQSFLVRLKNGGKIKLHNKPDSKKSLTKKTDENNLWYVKIILQKKDSKEFFPLYAGASNKSNYKEDFFDIMKPPTLKNTMDCYFENKALLKSGKFIGDMRSPNKQLYEYNIFVLLKSNSEYKVNLKSNNLPKGYKTLVVDADNNIAIEKEEFNLVGTKKRFKLFIGQTSEIESIKNNYSELPLEYKISNNYPNPFNISTTIRYSLPSYSRVTITIYDILGRKVRSLVNNISQIGNQEITWKGENENGNIVSSGIYLFRIESKFGTNNLKMLLLK